MAVAPPLPFPLSSACSGSNGDVMAVAGGYNGELDKRYVDVYVIRNLEEGWRRVEGAALPVETVNNVTSSQAGVMIGNKLVCLGGYINDEVSWSAV